MPLLNNDYLPFIQFNPYLTGLSVRFVCPMIIKIIPLHLSRDKSLCPLDLNLNDCVITLSPCCKHFTPSHIIMWELSPKKLLISKTQFNRLYDNCDRRVFNFLADINKVTQEFISNINEFKISCSAVRSLKYDQKLLHFISPGFLCISQISWMLWCYC